MKQLTLSNVIAIVAILLCFYAFAGAKQGSATDEKEYCILKTCASRSKMHILAYSNGKYESMDVEGYLKNNPDPYLLKLISKTIAQLCSEGWALKEQSMVSDVPGVVIEEYIFERTKQ